MKNDTRYFDRDLSWLGFNHRVLEEAADETVPLYERIKFLAIYSSNLDEFFRVRVAGLRSLVDIGKKKINKEVGIKPEKHLGEILKVVNEQLDEFGSIKRKQIIPSLKANNIILYRNEPILEIHKKVISQYFKSRVLSYLQPVIFKAGKKVMPFLDNRALYFAVALELAMEDEEKETFYAIVNIPTDHLPRFIALPKVDDMHYYIAIDDVIRENLNHLFIGYEVKGCYSIKLNRDADLAIEDEFSGDLVEKIKKQITKRNLGAPSRFLYDSAMPDTMLEVLKATYRFKEEDVIPGGVYHNMNDLFGLANPLKPQLENVSLPAIEKGVLEKHLSIFEAIDEGNQLLHFPYHSYDYVLRFFNEAAIDPYVKEIKATFYRVASNSFIINALISAAKNGKKVTVFVELKARFDEANNIKWAKRMEEEGIKIIYSIPGLKVHAKVALVTRKSASGTKRYAFLGTGNFNEKTANIYADHGLLTCNDKLTNELDMVFKYLYKRKPITKLKHLLVSQFNMQQRFIEMIEREIGHAKMDNKGHIIIKVNNLEDEIMINKLYEASQAGVKIELIIRGICCLVPGVAGLSENIVITRIVDRFLEHARVFLFYNNGEDELYLGSADWMKRNLYRRIEVIFPIYDTALKNEVKKLIQLQLEDNTSARRIDSNGQNVSIPKSPDAPEVRAQADFYYWLKAKEEHAEEANELPEKTTLQ